ncbi:MAG: hypothetical protein N4A53_08885 [Pelagimonas sp.]|jgi:uncharacterized protein (DUF4415 family)|nr:hypothetical protein [Pelagimonas sp.]
MLSPEERASLEAARRMVCGDRGDIYVFEDGKLLVSSAFALNPSRDPIDALKGRGEGYQAGWNDALKGHNNGTH